MCTRVGMSAEAKGWYLLSSTLLRIHYLLSILIEIACRYIPSPLFVSSWLWLQSKDLSRFLKPEEDWPKEKSENNNWVGNLEIIMNLARGILGAGLISRNGGRIQETGLSVLKIWI